MSERGPQGDHGQAGSSGQAGASGQRGYVGERGRDGQTGGTGVPGQTGRTGDTGQTGQMGPSVLSRTQTLAMFLFVVIAFTLLAYRSEVNADNIKENNTKQLEQDQYSQCLNRNENIERSNNLYEGLIWIERKNPFASQSKEAFATIQSRIQLYEQNMLIPLECGGKP